MKKTSSFILKIILAIAIAIATILAISILLDQPIYYIFLSFGVVISSYRLWYSIKRENPGNSETALNWWYPIGMFILSILSVFYILDGKTNSDSWLANYLGSHYYILLVLITYCAILSVSLYRSYISDLSKTSILQLTFISLILSYINAHFTILLLASISIIAVISSYYFYYKKQIPIFVKRILVTIWAANIIYLSFLSYNFYNHFNLISQPENHANSEIFIYGMVSFYLLFNVFIVLRTTNILSTLNLIFHLIPSRHYEPVEAISNFKKDIVYTGQCIADPIHEDKLKIIIGNIIMILITAVLAFTNWQNPKISLLIINGSLIVLPIANDLLDSYLNRHTAKSKNPTS